MTNSNRIEQATREYVGLTLTSEEITALVHKRFPEWSGGIYPSDSAYAKTADGTFVPRGKQAYGDGVLQYIGSNAFKVLPTEAIVRKPSSGRGRGTTQPKPESEVLAGLAKKLAAVQAEQTGKSVKKNGESAH